jgi:hypothetical protein
MRNWILGLGLGAVTAGGVTFVLSGDPHRGHCGPCVSPASTPSSEVQAGPGSTSTCPGGTCGVVDVTDLPKVFATPAEPTGPFISFDEPPLAKPLQAVPIPEGVMLRPRGSMAVVPVKFEVPVEVLEEAPMPREVPAVEVAPPPRPLDPPPARY